MASRNIWREWFRSRISFSRSAWLMGAATSGRAAAKKRADFSIGCFLYWSIQALRPACRGCRAYDLLRAQPTRDNAAAFKDSTRIVGKQEVARNGIAENDARAPVYQNPIRQNRSYPRTCEIEGMVGPEGFEPSTNGL